MSPALRIGAAGFGVIAVCYGFARFAFGLFLPQIDAELALGPALAGVISGGSFAAYCLAIIVAARLTERVGARFVAVMAGVVAAVGMAGIALAPSPLVLGAAVLVAGTSTGLASPPMAAAVAAAVRPERQDVTNTAINAGTSAGVALSGPVLFAAVGHWRLAFAAFAAAAVIAAVAAASALPRGRGGEGVKSGAGSAGWPAVTPTLVRLAAAALLAGAASTALWTFGSQLVTDRFGWGPAGTATLWSAIGAGGVAGAAAGGLVARFGLDPVHRAVLVLMAAGLVAVGAPVAGEGVALAGGAVFGAAYITLSGVYLVWAVRALPDRPATGLTIAFLALAIGQTAGAPAFGLLLERFGAGPAVAAFVAIALCSALFRAERTAARASAAGGGARGA